MAEFDSRFRLECLGAVIAVPRAPFPRVTSDCAGSTLCWINTMPDRTVFGSGCRVRYPTASIDGRGL